MAFHFRNINCYKIDNFVQVLQVYPQLFKGKYLTIILK